eukprot:TRINITY_DN14456_c0_g1_i1.p1 TRINITY_DN14456_c0_g1~~TRINITY_DN14456_c0_g1_i1.p1  ORF type:complete len:1014 (-),score=251.52 TRINITY_DN14456_c0_g1_i1:111-3152(-)
MAHLGIPGVTEWHWDVGDPEEIFFLEEEIASGSFGTVYKARNQETGQYAALKITQAQEEDEISDYIELTILRKCDHPNIAKLFGCWRKGSETFMALEYCGGGAIGDFYQVWNISWSEEQIRFVVRETVKGLQYMHQNGLIHRDIKGANILLTDHGDVKLIDFGVSAILASSDQKRNTLIGTPYWMAPEVIANKTRPTPYDESVDVWSVGITAIELAEKEPPLSQMNPMRALMQIPLRNAPTLMEPEKWSKEFNDFLDVTLEKDPKKRARICDLLEHPFLKKPVDKSVVQSLIETAARERARILAEESSNGDFEDPQSEDEISSTNDTSDLKSEPEDEDSLASGTVVVYDIDEPQEKEYHKEKSPTSEEKESASVERANSTESRSGRQKSKRSGDKKEKSKKAKEELSTSPVSTPRGTTSSNKSNEPPAGRGAPAYLPSGGRGQPIVSLPSLEGMGRGIPGRSHPALLSPAPQRINRDTRRPQAGTTKHEKEMMAVKSSNQNLMRKQMNALRVHIKKNRLEMEKMKAKDAEKEAALLKKNQTKSSKLKSAQLSNSQRAAKQREVDSSNLERNFQDNLKNLQKQAEERQRRVLKEHKDNNTDLLSDFKKDTKAMHKDELNLHKEAEKSQKIELKKLPKKEKTPASKAAKLQNLEHLKMLQQRHDQRLLRFNLELKEHTKYGENSAKWISLWEQQHATRQYLNEKNNAESEYLLAKYEQDVANEKETYKLEFDLMQQIQALELQNFVKQMELEITQLKNVQAAEKMQQDEMLTFDHRSALREFNRNKLADEKALKAQIKRYKKENRGLSKGQLKSYETHTTVEWETKQIAKAEEFEQQQALQREEEEQLLRCHHDNQMEKALTSLQEAKAEKMRINQQLQDDLTNENILALTNLEKKYWTDRLYTSRKQHAEVIESENTYFQSERSLLTEQITDVTLMLKSFQEEFDALAVEQGLPEQQKSDILASVTAYTSEVIVALTQVQASLVVVQQEELQQLKAQFHSSWQAISDQAPPNVF